MRDCHNWNGSALFGGVGGWVNSEKLKKLGIFNFEEMIKSLMKFHI